MSGSSSMISGIKNLAISGGHFDFHHHNSDTGILEYHRHISIDALYNSQERSSEGLDLMVRNIVERWRPRVQEKSLGSPLSTNDLTESSLVERDNIEEALDDIFTWLYDPCSSSLMVWVYDDEDREETRLVSQIVADILDEREDLSASFFFTAESAVGRADDIIPTITHQLAQRIPEAKALIEAAAHSTALFRWAPKEQIKQLIVNPLQEASPSSLSARRRKFILIHGLEHCNETFQELFIGHLLDALGLVIKQTKFPHRLLLLGRPTNNLRRYFSGRPDVRHCPMSNQERMMCRREERLQEREKELKKRQRDLQREEEEFAQQRELLEMRRRNCVRPGCTCHEHMSGGHHNTERCQIPAQNQTEPPRVQPAVLAPPSPKQFRSLRGGGGFVTVPPTIRLSVQPDVLAPPPPKQFRSLRGGGGRNIGAPKANSWKGKLKRFLC